MNDQQQKERPRNESSPWDRKGDADPFAGPHAPETTKPDTKAILDKLRKVEQNQSKKYRQRSGE